MLIRNYRQWEDRSVELLKMRELGRKHNDSAFYMPLVKTRPPETISNMAICLIKQTDFMLFKHLQAIIEDFLKNGGMRERMTKMRLDRRK
ncbi:MAG: four helix bundle suffix domain-containing protein [Bacteroidota bacterium]|nr:four helix bundle suffix domain-containing protein [Bacteroidota bacterium]